ncbi:FAD-dependent oxidoreductase [Desulfofundulus thermocisternus]|uniref:FAD-dependent oxidoreductase n=1 Tax=Desulfofundulus thermocisternus TaxID=42471 RepID=UPI00048899E5|nr:FAD-dependent oxidoreductase [Desulfofundulus thermocisternus]
MEKGRKKILIIGGVAAGPKAAARARRCDPDAEITIVEEGSFLSYAGCGMPFYIGGTVERHEELMATPVGVIRDAAFFRSVKDIKVLTGTRAEAIDRKNKTVRVTNLATGETSALPYDKLVLATGSRPVRLPVPGADLAGVYTLGNLEEAQAIRRAVEQGARRVVIIGGGLIGLELADTLGTKAEIAIFEMMDHVLSSLLDPELSILVEKVLRGKGVQLFLGNRVERIEGNEQGAVARVVTTAGSFPADLVVIAAGVKPRVELAKEAGLELGETGAIKVNAYLQTSDPDIYAGGDCVENVHLISGRPVYTPMGSVANRHGRVIGDNVTGGRQSFPGVLGTAILKVFEMIIGRTGLTESEARRLGYHVESFICSAPDRAHFYPGSKPIIIKLVADSSTRKLLGAQILGPGDVNKRLDVMVAALSMGVTVDQLAAFDLAYAPPFSTALDPITHAANCLRNKIDGRARSINPLELKKRLSAGEELILLDVRTPAEFNEVRLPGSNVVFIPLGKLRERAAELPRDREIVTFCKLSLRGWEAQTILESLGFTNVSFFEGGIVAWPFELETGPRQK